MRGKAGKTGKGNIVPSGMWVKMFQNAGLPLPFWPWPTSATMAGYVDPEEADEQTVCDEIRYERSLEAR